MASLTTARRRLMKELFLQLISATRGNGPSSTRLIYVVNGLAASFCAVLATLSGIIVYCAANHAANPVYWGGVAALWTATLGFGSSAKKEQQKATRDIAAAPRPQVAMAVSGD